MAPLTVLNAPTPIDQQLIHELTMPVPEPIVAFATALAQSFPQPPLGVLFYGSQSRLLETEGLLDFYVIFAERADLPGNFWAQLGNRLLPPNVIYREHGPSTQKLRAKVALLTLRQFKERAQFSSTDTTIWARFCQPVRLVWVKNPQAADRLLAVLHDCILTAATWAALLYPAVKGLPAQYWHNLFSSTYGAELRVERKGRSKNLLQDREPRYILLLEAAWKELRVPFKVGKDGKIFPELPRSLRDKAQKRWQKIARAGKGLNFTRLLKAAFTFRGGVAYLNWKIKRHTGQDIAVTAFEQKHPLLSLPLLLWRFRKVRRDVH